MNQHKIENTKQNRNEKFGLEFQLGRFGFCCRQFSLFDWIEYNKKIDDKATTIKLIHETHTQSPRGFSG